MSKKFYKFLTLTFVTIIFSQSIIGAVETAKEAEIANLRIRIKELETSLYEKLKLFQEQDEKLNQLDKKIKEQMENLRPELNALAECSNNKEDYKEKWFDELEIYEKCWTQKVEQNINQNVSRPMISETEQSTNDYETNTKHAWLRIGLQATIIWKLEKHKWENYYFELVENLEKLIVTEKKIKNLLIQI